jgi:flagellar hook-associated protein 1 FlgK
MAGTISNLLEIGLRALMSNQMAVQVSAHNIANANTDGYSRQKVILSPTSPFSNQSLAKPLMAGQMGTGDGVARVRRMRDEFLDGQYRKVLTSVGEWDVRADMLERIEYLLNEPSENGIASAIDGFFSQWHELSKNPESMAVRASVREAGSALSSALRFLRANLSDLKDSFDRNIAVMVEEINSIAERVAELNGKIATLKVSGGNPSDLEDLRDLLLDNLSKIVPISKWERSDGMVDIFVGSHALVSGVETERLMAGPTSNGKVYAVWFEGGDSFIPLGGKLKGYMEARETAGKYISLLDSLASRIIESVNSLHRLGYGLGGSTDANFFSGSDSSDIGIDPLIEEDLGRIAAAKAPNAPGDGSNALDIANIIGSKDDPAELFRSILSRLGIESQEARNSLEASKVVEGQIANHREAISGVSLDEEIAALISYQRAYSAAARFITIVDEMLDIIVNRLGLVGR